MPQNVKSWESTDLQNPIERLYTSNKQVLIQTDKAKYLGVIVIIIENLDWNPHINSIVTKQIDALASPKKTLGIANKNSENWNMYPKFDHN